MDVVWGNSGDRLGLYSGDWLGLAEAFQRDGRTMLYDVIVTAETIYTPTTTEKVSLACRRFMSFRSA